MKTIPLSRGLEAIVDDEDFEWLSQWKWSARKAPYTFYATRSIYGNSKCVQLLMHRLIMNASDDVIVDHINGSGLDNRRCNLRFASFQHSRTNSRLPKNNKSGFKGVSWAKKSYKWTAQITIQRKVTNLGFFHDPKDAAEIYDKAALAAFGAYAKTNQSLGILPCP